jgi:hypothetical protein
MSWISLCWNSLKGTLFSIQYKQYNLQYRHSLLYIVGWNVVCIHNNILDVFNVVFIVHNITLFIFITIFYGTDNIMHNISHIHTEDGEHFA